MTSAGRNLLVITNSFPDKDDKHVGGIFVKDQLRELSSHFDNVYVVFPSTLGMGHEPKEDFRDYSFGNVKVFFLGYFNVPVFLKVFRGGFTYLMARAVDGLIRRRGLKFDMIHAHFTWPSGAAAARLKEKYGVPLVVTEHTSLTFKKAVASKDPQFVGTWLAADAVTRVRQGDLDEIAALGVPRDRIWYVPNGFNGSKFRPMDRAECRKRLGLPTEGRVLLSVGGLDDVKGHRYLVEAMGKVLAEHGDVTCLIVGSGPLHASLKAQIASMGLVDRVRLVGAKPHGEMHLWMGASDMMVHPSLSEGNPTVMFESLGCGRPFIGTRVGGIPEVVTSEEVGILCAPENPGALADAILRGLSMEWDSKRISSHAQRYAWENIARELVSIFDRVTDD